MRSSEGGEGDQSEKGRKNEGWCVSVLSRMRRVMGFLLPRIVTAKRTLIRSLSSSNQTADSKTVDIPKGYFAVYVGDSRKKRFVIPISYMNEPLFLDLLSQAEEDLLSQAAVKTHSFVSLLA
ncbi:hypothetical protein DVH24_002520 [Malus domestica]|uniref:Uncharacterized protein n=1 Tax=Malus domestica TaxID=3750 RepID=A0A498IU36_MALDO|nr:hypothetical protein DVH24_002520 [Malus domestica]